MLCCPGLLCCVRWQGPASFDCRLLPEKLLLDTLAHVGLADGGERHLVASPKNGMFLPGCVGLDAAQELRPISEVLVVAERLEGPRALLAQGEGSPLDHGLVQQAPQSLEGQAGVGLLRLGLLTGPQEADHARRVQQLSKNQALPGQTWR